MSRLLLSVFFASALLLSCVSATVTYSSTINTLTSSCSTPYGFAIDSYGNLFTACATANQILYFASGVGSGTPLSGSCASPHNPYVDAYDNMYVSCYTSNSIAMWSYPAPSSTATALPSQTSSCSQPVATFASGSLVFAACHSSKSIAYWSNYGATASGFLPGSSSCGGPQAFALWGNNLYAACQTSSSIMYFPGLTGTGVTLESPGGYPNGLAFDNAGNLFVATWNNNAIVKYTGATGSPAAFSTCGNGQYLWTSCNGDLYAVCAGSNTVQVYQCASASALTAITCSGATGGVYNSVTSELFMGCGNSVNSVTATAASGCSGSACAPAGPPATGGPATTTTPGPTNVCVTITTKGEIVEIARKTE